MKAEMTEYLHYKIVECKIKIDDLEHEEIDKMQSIRNMMNKIDYSVTNAQSKFNELIKHYKHGIDIIQLERNELKVKISLLKEIKKEIERDVL